MKDAVPIPVPISLMDPLPSNTNPSSNSNSFEPQAEAAGGANAAGGASTEGKAQRPKFSLAMPGWRIGGGGGGNAKSSGGGAGLKVDLEVKAPKSKTVGSKLSILGTWGQHNPKVASTNGHVMQAEP